jgi:hypothetical protein
MPVSTMIVLAGVVAMFTVFACALAWAQLQTRHITGTPVPAEATSRTKKRPF